MTRLLYLVAGYALRAAECCWHTERYALAVVALAVAAGLVMLDVNERKLNKEKR